MKPTNFSLSTRALFSIPLILLVLGAASCQRSQSEAAFPVNETEPIAQAAVVVASPSSSPSPAAASPAAWTREENDYLFDLSQALQQAELARVAPQERLAIGRNIHSWLKATPDYWQIRAKFDANYQNVVAGDYVTNREVYIRYATARLAPRYGNTLKPPSEVKSVATSLPEVSTPAAFVPSASAASAQSGRHYTCAEIGDWNEAQRLLSEGHTYLDRDRDGEACEALR
jgi:hypothetical protein